jgi:protein tyrosine/serine phosphatase
MRVVTERRLDWAGCVNVRDLGGHRLPGGGSTAFGAIVRADSIRSLSDEGWEALVEYGVRTIVDLRRQVELDDDPPREAPVDVVHVPLVDDRDVDAMAHLERWTTTTEAYLGILEHFRANFARAVTEIARAPEGAVLVHCQAGKDRTGLVVALLLTLAGVSPEDIAADYDLSAANLTQLTDEWIAEAPDERERERRRRVSAGGPQAMLDVLAELDARYGSVRSYLLAAGADEATLDRAVERLV